MEKIYINGEYKTIGGVKQIVGNAPKHLDTLEEIAEVIESGDKEVILDLNLDSDILKELYDDPNFNPTAIILDNGIKVTPEGKIIKSEERGSSGWLAIGISYTTEYFSIRCDLNIDKWGSIHAIGVPKIACLTYYLYEKTFLQDLKKWANYITYGEIEDYVSNTYNLPINRGVFDGSSGIVIKVNNTVFGSDLYIYLLDLENYSYKAYEKPSNVQIDPIPVMIALGKNLGIFSDTYLVHTELGLFEAEWETIIRESGMEETRTIIPKICVENLVVTNALFSVGTLVLDGARSQIFIERTNDEDFVTCLHILKNFFLTGSISSIPITISEPGSITTVHKGVYIPEMHGVIVYGMGLGGFYMLDENGELQVASELEQLPQDYINMLTFGLEYKFLLDKINSLQQTVTLLEERIAALEA